MYSIEISVNWFTDVACGRLDGHIDELLHMLGKIYRWCVTAFSTGPWNISIPVDQVLEDWMIETHVQIDASCEQWWPPE